MSAFPDLPFAYDRHKEALVIVDPGASNPAGVALAIHRACRRVIAENGSQRGDPAVRLMVTQLSYLVRGNSDLPLDDYQALIDTCRVRAGERPGTTFF